MFAFQGHGTEVFEAPVSGRYRMLAVGAKAADGSNKKGGRGARVAATFHLEAGDAVEVCVCVCVWARW